MMSHIVVLATDKRRATRILPTSIVSRERAGGARRCSGDSAGIRGYEDVERWRLLGEPGEDMPRVHDDPLRVLVNLRGPKTMQPQRRQGGGRAGEEGSIEEQEGEKQKQ